MEISVLVNITTIPVSQYQQLNLRCNVEEEVKRYGDREIPL